MNNNNSYYKQFFFNEEEIYSLIIEEYNDTAYAYLLQNENILSEVWLYNLGKSKYEKWENLTEDDFPLQHIDDYISIHNVKIYDDKDLVVQSTHKDGIFKVFITIDDKIEVLLKSDEKVGYTNAVNFDTPIAKIYSRPN